MNPSNPTLEHTRKYRRYDSQEKPKEATSTDDPGVIFNEKLNDELIELYKLEVPAIIARIKNYQSRSYFISELTKKFLSENKLTEACHLIREMPLDRFRTEKLGQIFIQLAKTGNLQVINENLPYVPAENHPFILFGVAIGCVNVNWDSVAAVLPRLTANLKLSLFHQMKSYPQCAQLFSQTITNLVEQEKIEEAVFLTQACTPEEGENLRFMIGKTLIELSKPHLLGPVYSKLTSRHEELQLLQITANQM